MYSPPGYVWVAALVGPIAFIILSCLVLYGGAIRAGLRRSTATLTAAAAATALGGWLAISAVFADHGWYETTAAFPLLPVASVGALAVFLALTRTPAVTRTLAAPGMTSRLILPQTVRVTGVAPLLYLALGHLPALFALPAALGDIASGTAAAFVTRRLATGAGSSRGGLWFNAFGITDLVVSVTTGSLTSYQLIHVTPATDLGQLPIALVPTAVVPMLLALHIISIGSLRTTAKRPLPAINPAGATI